MLNFHNMTIGWINLILCFLPDWESLAHRNSCLLGMPRTVLCLLFVFSNLYFAFRENMLSCCHHSCHLKSSTCFLFAEDLWANASDTLKSQLSVDRSPQDVDVRVCGFILRDSQHSNLLLTALGLMDSSLSHMENMLTFWISTSLIQSKYHVWCL